VREKRGIIVAFNDCGFAVLEEQKAGVQKEASDLRASLREVEKARLDARRELQELRRQVKMLDSERNKLGQEVVDLQGRVARDEEKDEEARKENFGLKQKVRLRLKPMLG
jgi:rootletin